MIALDTNVLVRLLVDDHPGQAEAARKLVRENRVLILRSVLLETEWVLRSRFKRSKSFIALFFSRLALTDNFVLEDEALTRRALGWYTQGLDFGDALHLASVGDTPLYTFDEKLVKRAVRFRDEAGVSMKSIKLIKML